MATATENRSTLESQTLFNLALEKINRRRFDEALEHLSDACRMVPDNPLYASYLGLCIAQETRDYPRALRICTQALNDRPREPVIHVNLGKVHRLMGDNSTAYEILLRAYAIDKQHPATASELTRMGIRRPPFFTFLSRRHWINRYLGIVRATLERKLVGKRQS